MNEMTIQQKEPSTHVRQPEVTRGLAFTPRVDVFEMETELLLFADLPGVKPDDVEMRFENGELILHGRCTPRQTENDYLLQEYGVGDFYRAFAIAEVIDSDKISAELKDGVLTVHLPKPEAVRPRRITVKAE